MVATGGSGVLGGVTNQVAIIAGLDIAIAIFGTVPTVTAGGASVARTLELSKNGVVAGGFVVRLRVTRAEWFKAVDVAQVRPASGTRGAAVVDFGIPRTVSAVAAMATGTAVGNVHRWLGASFDKESSLLDSVEGFRGGARPLATEVRTERLQVELTGASSFDAIRDQIAVRLPEIPADLELRIDGATPVWTSPGTVTPSELPADTPPIKLVPGRTLNGGMRWIAASATELIQDVDLGDVLTALLGDPSAGPDDEREITLVLSARIPGAIGMDTPAEPAALLRHRARVTEGFVDGRRDVRFAAEGMQRIALAMPSWATAVHSAECTLAASCDDMRTIPAVGPEPTELPANVAPGGAADIPVAEFVLDGERTIALRLPNEIGLATLVAVRVPLRVDRSGCEIRAVLLGADGIDPTAPGVPLDGGSGTPTTVDGVAGAQEQWVTLAFPSPVTLPPDTRHFVALHFIRGSATMAAIKSAGPSAPTAGVCEVWRGPPAGPWEVLPEGAGLRGLRGRLRATGVPPSGNPIAPLRVALGADPGAANGVTPSPKGVPVVLHAATSAPAQADLRIVALTPCTVSVRDVIVTVSR